MQSALHSLEAAVGAVMVLTGITALNGWGWRASAGSRWHAPRLVGTADAAMGVGLLVYGLQPQHDWAGLVFLVAFVFGAICMVTWVVKAARHDPFEDE